MNYINYEQSLPRHKQLLIFVNGRSQLSDLQQWDVCDNIQDAVSLDVESRKLKLWILDKGNEKCSPKLLSYSLLYNDILETIDFKDIVSKDWNCLEIEQRSKDHDTKAYIGNAGN